MIRFPEFRFLISIRLRKGRITCTALRITCTVQCRTALGAGAAPVSMHVAVQVALQKSAIKLFLQGARRAEPGFELTDQNLGAVVRIYRLVEGMPLAIRPGSAVGGPSLSG